MLTPLSLIIVFAFRCYAMLHYAAAARYAMICRCYDTLTLLLLQLPLIFSSPFRFFLRYAASAAAIDACHAMLILPLRCR